MPAWVLSVEILNRDKILFLNTVQKPVLMLLAACLLSVNVLAKIGNAPSEEIRRALPNQLGEFRALGPIWTPPANHLDVNDIDQITRVQFNASAIASRTYRAKDGEELSILIFNCRSESSAYAFLTNSWRLGHTNHEVNPESRYGEIGTASRADGDVLKFVKGSTLVHIAPIGMAVYDAANTTKLGRAVAELIDKGSGDIPVLAKHLPEWETVKQHLLYVVSSKTLNEVVPNQPVLDALSFEGGAEAVVAIYGSSQLVIVEFNTPQLAGDNDGRITAKIQELRKQGQSVPTAYRRVGNYSVFVFNAPDERTANQLIDQVKYQQVVQWLGNPPDNLAERRREFIYTTLGVFVSVVKASGIAIVLCVAVGGLLGALLFSRRRARQASAQAYSDAGGMLRLNIDELSPPTDAGKLIGPGNE
jgi:hypothetical protein